MSHAGTLAMIPALGYVAGKVAEHKEQLLQDLNAALSMLLDTPIREMPVQLLLQVLAALVLAVAVLMWYVRKAAAKPKPVYLLDFAMAHPPDTWRFSKERFVPANSLNTRFNPESLDFLGKMLERSGLGNDTYTPPWLVNEPIVMDIAHARLEFEVTCFTAVQELLNKTGIQPRQIGCVIVNSSLFNPTPSLAAMIMNHFKMGSKTINYNLGGMGCSASLVAIDLAKQVLATLKDTYVLVVSHENITNNWYPGNDRSMLLPNCIFRCNGAAMLMTNKPTEARRAKYELQHLVRVNLAGQDRAYRCVYQLEDENGDLGVRLSKDLTAVAASALQKNMVTLGPLVLPFSEKFLFAVNLLKRKFRGKKVAPYTPDFQLAFDHICIHSGGRAVIDGMQKHLALSDAAIEPSRAGLYRWGNVSSASVWYVLSYIETYKGLKGGDKVWQLSFGSGFKCNSAVWVAKKTFKDPHTCWTGFDPAKMWEDLNALTATLAAEKAAKRAAAEKAGQTLPEDGH
uniref:3-ketoacyl-CoA synthase n=1 Tax=Tetradesmus obliquus TaxID=3088 RepID=A0A383VBC9_TETOB|eukprot:jgi/Sobl393_1/6801/SZX62253.1